jgi:hypothetical protein
VLGQLMLACDINRDLVRIDHHHNLWRGILTSHSARHSFLINFALGLCSEVTYGHTDDYDYKYDANASFPL